MLRDPLYNEIINRLNKTLDPEIFEQCAADLIGKIHPGTVPIAGGSDFGMDGAIPDGKGTAFPLITTTGKNVIGNMAKNLKTYKKNFKRRKAIVATSQKLTPKKRTVPVRTKTNVPIRIFFKISDSNFLDSCLDRFNLKSTAA